MRLLPLVLLLAACSSAPASLAERNWRTGGERHFRRVTRLTFGGKNAEAYFSPDGSTIIFQSQRDGRDVDTMYLMRLDGSRVTQVSSGDGRTTCGYFLSDQRFLYSSTHLAGPRPPQPSTYEGGYAWPVFDAYDIFLVNPYENSLTQLTNNPGYDAEATVHWPTDTIVFTSMREGDIDLYSMAPDGRQVRRITSRVGYEGGAVMSPDGRRIVYRAYYPETEEETAQYTALLERRLVSPPYLDLYIANADGSDPVRLTNYERVCFAPFWHPDGERILFMGDVSRPHEYDIFMIRADGTGLQRVTSARGFDGFPVFSPDGRRLLWASKRADSDGESIDLYLAEWID